MMACEYKRFAATLQGAGVRTGCSRPLLIRYVGGARKRRLAVSGNLVRWLVEREILICLGPSMNPSERNK